MGCPGRRVRNFQKLGLIILAVKASEECISPPGCELITLSQMYVRKRAFMYIGQALFYCTNYHIIGAHILLSSNCELSTV